MSKISVIVLVGNSQRCYNQCTDGALRQTSPDLEVILAEEPSAEAKNRAIEAATGEWIAFVDSRDEAELGMIEKMAGLLENLPERVELVMGGTARSKICSSQEFLELVPELVERNLIHHLYLYI